MVQEKHVAWLRMFAILLVAVLAWVVQPQEPVAQEEPSHTIMPCPDSEPPDSSGTCGGGGGGGGGGTPALNTDPAWTFIKSLDQEPFLNADTGDFGVVLSNGEYVHQVVDLRIPGRGMDFVLTRTYRSRTNITTVLGEGWNFSYNERMVHHTSEGFVEWIRGDSWSDAFTWDTTFGWEAFSGFFGYLKQAIGVTFPYGAEFGLRYPDGTIHYYADDGCLLAIVDRNGNAIEFYYRPDNKIDYAIDTMGRRITFTHNDTTGLLESVTDHDGRTISYTYQNDRLWEVRSPLVELEEGGTPVVLTTTYTYLNNSAFPDLDGNIQSITDAKGQTHTSISYGIGAEDLDRVTSIRRGDQTPGVQEVTYAYEYIGTDPNNVTEAKRKTTITDRRGNVREHYYNSRGHLIKLIGKDNPAVPDGDGRDIITQYTYTLSSGRLLQVIYPEENETRYYYDGAEVFCPQCVEGNINKYRGANITKVEQIAGPRGDGNGGALLDRVTRIKFDPIYNQPIQVTDPLNAVTTNQLDYEEMGCGSAARTALMDYADDWAIDLTGDNAPTCGLGDLNADGKTSRWGGNAVKEIEPDYTDLRYQGLQPGPETKIQYNTFGQPTKVIDPEGFVTHFDYYPENAPFNGIDLTPDPPNRTLNAANGGYQKAVVVDAVDGGLGRPSVAVPEPTELRIDYEYDARGNKIKMIDSRGVVNRTYYNALNLPLRMVAGEAVEPAPRGEASLAAIGRYAKLKYDQNLNVIEQRSPASETTPGITEVVTTMEYDLLDHLLKSTLQYGPLVGDIHETHFGYNLSEDLIRIVNPEGRVVFYEYDDQGRTFRTTRFANRLVVPVVAADMNPLADPLHDTVSQNEFNLNSEVVKDYDRSEGTTGYPSDVDFRSSTYNGFGETVQVNNEACTAVRRTFDERGQVKTQGVWGPVGGETPRAGSSEGCASSYPQLTWQEIDYDEHGRLIEARVDDFKHGADPLTENIYNSEGAHILSQRMYHPRGLVARVVGDRGAVTDVEYDGAGRKTKTEIKALDSGGTALILVQSVSVEFDAGGNVIHSTTTEYDESGAATSYEAFASHDAMGNVLTATLGTGPEASTETISYDILGNAKEKWNPLNAETKIVYDAYNRAIQSDRYLRKIDGTLDTNFANPDGIVRTQYGFTADGLLASRTDDRGSVVTYTYDGLERTVTVELPDDIVRTTAYSPEGNPLRVEVRGPGQAPEDPALVEYTMAYDALNRMISRDAIVLPASDITAAPYQTFEYDGLGRLKLARDDNGGTIKISEVERTYDSLGRALSEDQTFLGQTRTVSSTYANDGFRLTFTDASIVSDPVMRSAVPDTLGRLESFSETGKYGVVYKIPRS